MACTSGQWASVIAPRVAGDDPKARSACTARLPGGGFGLTARLVHCRPRRNAARPRLTSDFRIPPVDRYGIPGMERFPRPTRGVGDPVLIPAPIATANAAPSHPSLAAPCP